MICGVCMLNLRLLGLLILNWLEELMRRVFLVFGWDSERAGVLWLEAMIL